MMRNDGAIIFNIRCHLGDMFVFLERICFGSICSLSNLVFYKICLEKMLEKLFECIFLVCILFKWYQNRDGNGIDISLNNF